MIRAPSLAQLARERAGYTLAQVARLLRTSPAALRRLERVGGWSDLRAERLARLYQCPLDCFPRGGKTRALSPSIRRAIREKR